MNIRNIISSHHGILKSSLPIGDLPLLQYQESVSLTTIVSTFNPSDAYVSPDGYRAYIAMYDTLLAVNRVYQLSLPSSFVLTGYTVAGSKLTHSTSTAESGKVLLFNPNGSMYFINTYGGLQGYTLSTPWNITTSSITDPTNYYAFPPNMLSLIDITFNSDGTKLYVLNTTGTIFQHTLPTPYYLGTMTYDGVSYTVPYYTTQTPYPYVNDIAFGYRGYRLFMVSDKDNMMYQYNLTVPYDISTISYSGYSFNLSTYENAVSSINIINDNLYITGTGTRTFKRFKFIFE